jgi:hypothetical protein
MIWYSCNCDADHELSSMQVTHEELTRSRCGTYAYTEYMYINTIFYFLLSSVVYDC